MSVKRGLTGAARSESDPPSGPHRKVSEAVAATDALAARAKKALEIEEAQNG
jgi:hypothetical protein